MIRLKQKLRGFTYKFGMARMRREFRLFAYTDFAFHAALSLADIFVSAFLFNVSGKMSTIAVYYFFFFLFEMIGIYAVVRFSDKINNVTFSAVGLILHAVAYGILLATRENAIYIYPAIAIVCGLGSGFYWVSYYSLLQVYTDASERQFGMAFISLVLNVLALSAPIISGAVLSKITGITGYIIVFSIALVFFAVAVFFELKLQGTAPENKSRKLLPIVKKMWHEKVINYSMLGEFISGLRGGVYTFYLGILIYSMTSNEFVLCLSNTFKGGAAILVAYILSRINFGPKARATVLMLSLYVCLVITGSLFFWYGALAVIVYYVINNATDVIGSHFKTYMGYEVAEYTSKLCGCDCGMEYSALKLIALEMGRLCGIGVSFLVPGESMTWIVIFFVILTFLNIFSGVFYKKAADLCGNEE